MSVLRVLDADATSVLHRTQAMRRPTRLLLFSLENPFNACLQGVYYMHAYVWLASVCIQLV